MKMLTIREKDLDRDVVNPSQIRNVIKTFRAKNPRNIPQAE